jgi:hypothetical protein
VTASCAGVLKPFFAAFKKSFIPNNGFALRPI